MKRKKITAIILTLAMVMGLAACGGSSNSSSPSSNSGSAASGQDANSGEKTYKIALSNSYLENGWRQEMIASCELMAATDPYYENVQLDVYNTDNTVEAQVASLESLMEMGYDAFLIDACSDSGLNNVIDQAVAKGIVCITFDSNATTDSCYTISLDYDAAFGLVGAVICEAIGGKGDIAMDQGIWSTSNGQAMHDGALKGIQHFPDVKVVAEYEGEWNDGLNQDKVSTILATQHLDAVIGESHAASIIKAFKTAGLEPVPTSGDVYNMNMCELYYNDLVGGCVATYTGLSIIAMDTAIDILNGKVPDSKQIVIVPDANIVNADKIGVDKVEKWAKELGATYVLVKEGENFSKDWPEQFMWPCLPASYPRQLSAQAVIDYMASVF
ncbi:substrate-binding domain-containing protein [Oscillibacter sp.]|uniref:substrate-binding domain-containing protein n=1 Tax=Oscillibacter sp. TaxID=1945593 RepID=UPI0026280B98|nr:substrate-binding domain-containing protein [Oscillibacter sp.]MDD3347641.1 substrate-binding domain-containing protein [Oscillibacter sp.]